MRHRLSVLGCGALLAGLLLPSAPAASASMTTLAAIQVSGHGFGHGRGMGQWGAFGYASQYGWNYQQILSHYYGGTSLGTAPNPNITVHLSELDGADTVVVAPSGTSIVGTWTGGVVKATALRVTRTGSSETVFSGSSCGGPWTQVAVTGATVAIASALVGAATPTPAQPAASQVQVCIPGSGLRTYQGDIVAEQSGQTQNYLPLEDYVDGVVPQESPASWAYYGGLAALEAQAVAARSYALATVATSGEICDNTACQMYLGMPDQYGQTADAAVAATAGQVLVCNAGSTCGPAGSIAFAEYSASTGGYTAGGAFPAVPDLGDAVASNPSHDWTVALSAGQIEAAYPSIGALAGATVTQRNGLGDMGGRVLDMVLSGSAGSLTISGNQFAADFGLQSDWFSVAATTAASVPSAATSPAPAPAPVAAAAPPALGADNGYWVADAAGAVHTFGAAPLYGTAAGTSIAGRIVGMAPTADDAGYWMVGSNGGVLALGDASWFGSAGAIHLNQPILGMTATANGGGYWLVAGDGGIFTYGNAAFHGSTGAMHLDQPVVGMAATPDGGGYWLVAADGGIFSFGDAGFYGSMGGRHLDQPIVGMVPSSDGHGYFLVARDGGVFAFGDASFTGSLPGRHIVADVVAVQPTADNAGYYVLAANGAVYSFGDAVAMGDIPSSQPGWSGTAVGIIAHRALG